VIVCSHSRTIGRGEIESSGEIDACLRRLYDSAILQTLESCVKEIETKVLLTSISIRPQ